MTPAALAGEGAEESAAPAAEAELRVGWATGLVGWSGRAEREAREAREARAAGRWQVPQVAQGLVRQGLTVTPHRPAAASRARSPVPATHGGLGGPMPSPRVSRRNRRSQRCISAGSPSAAQTLAGRSARRLSHEERRAPRLQLWRARRARRARRRSRGSGESGRAAARVSAMTPVPSRAACGPARCSRMPVPAVDRTGSRSIARSRPARRSRSKPPCTTART